MAEYEIFLTGIVTSICGLIGILIINQNWFKKQKYKDEAANLRAENKIRLKKLERELLGNIAPTDKAQKVENAAPTLLTQIAPLLKGLDGEQIAGLIESLTGGAPAEETEEIGGLGGLLNRIVTENPELVQGFLQGLGKSGTGGSNTNY